MDTVILFVCVWTMDTTGIIDVSASCTDTVIYLQWLWF